MPAPHISLTLNLNYRCGHNSHISLTLNLIYRCGHNARTPHIPNPNTRASSHSLSSVDPPWTTIHLRTPTRKCTPSQRRSTQHRSAAPHSHWRLYPNIYRYTPVITIHNVDRAGDARVDRESTTSGNSGWTFVVVVVVVVGIRKSTVVTGFPSGGGVGAHHNCRCSQ
jgi:hypothetical protein